MEELEDAREVEGLEEVEGTAIEAPATETPPAIPELKVVVHLKGDRALVGVQGDGTDPVMEVITIANPEDALQEGFAAAADLLERARERWAASPRNPAYQGPPPPPATPSRPARRAPATPTAPKTAVAETTRLF